MNYNLYECLIEITVKGIRWDGDRNPILIEDLNKDEEASNIIKAAKDCEKNDTECVPSEESGQIGAD
jgi:hypothetical protein